MLSTAHEIMLELFRSRPGLAVDLLAGAPGITLPAHEQVRLEAADLVDLLPTEFRADAVVVLTAAGEPVQAVVVEIQLGRDGGKRWSWPAYVVNLRSRLRCPVDLLVVCPDAKIAAWCAAPIALGLSGSAVVPVVIGPERVPVVTDPAHAIRTPELAVLSALAHGADPVRRSVLDTFVTALGAVEPDHEFLYLELVYTALPEAARRHLEELMATPIDEHRSELAERLVAIGRERGEAAGQAAGQAEGKAEGRVAAVLAVLDARGIDPPAQARSRITACRDLAQLDLWVRRAATARSVDELFV